jgi:hypothetical protein
MVPLPVENGHGYKAALLDNLILHFFFLYFHGSYSCNLTDLPRSANDVPPTACSSSACKIDLFPDVFV